MTHIVFQEADQAVILKAMELDGGLSGPVICFPHDYSLGPVRDAPRPEPPPEVTSLDSPDEVWIWVAQNPRDVCGYYALLEALLPLSGRLQVLFLNNLPFLNEKGSVFYPGRLSEIPPTEFRKAKKLARPVTPSEFELDTEEWRRLREEDAPVRILEGAKKIIGKDVTYYDKDLLAGLGPNWQKAGRVLANTMHRMKPKVSEEFLATRLRELVASGTLQANGDAGTEIKLAGADRRAEPAEES